MGRKQPIGGSRKGKPNKKKQAFREWLQKYCMAQNADPFVWMADQLATVTTWTDADGQTHPTVPLAIKAECAAQLAQYLQPKLRSIVVSGDTDNPVQVLHAMPQDQLDALIQRKMREAGITAPAASDGGHLSSLPETPDRGLGQADAGGL